MPQNDELASFWLHKAAAQGVASAKSALATLRMAFVESQALLTSSTTGLPNLRAFQETEANRAANVVAVSMLDWLEHRGDDRKVLVKAKANALREAQLDAYHDEDRFDRFLYRGESPEELKSKLEKANETLRAQEVNVSDHRGGRCVIAGFEFTFGVGKSLREADDIERLSRQYEAT